MVQQHIGDKEIAFRNPDGDINTKVITEKSILQTVDKLELLLNKSIFLIGKKPTFIILGYEDYTELTLYIEHLLEDKTIPNDSCTPTHYKGMTIVVVNEPRRLDVSWSPYDMMIYQGWIKEQLSS